MGDLKLKPKHKQKHICWRCQDYTFVYMYVYGINGLCLACLQEKENTEFDDVNDDDSDNDKILITRMAKAYIDFLSTNDKTSRTYNPELNKVVASENKIKYDRIDKCKYKGKDH